MDTSLPLPQLWADLLGASTDLASVEFSGPRTVVGSVFDVTGFAASAVAAANLAVAELRAARTSTAVGSVHVGYREAAAAFSCERLLVGVGWELPPVWDPIAGDYRAADGWIRLHTNYTYHRDAVVEVLGVAADRDAVAAAVAAWDADDLESAVVGAGGCAAAMRDQRAWSAHPAGIAAEGEVPAAVRRVGGGRTAPASTAPLPPPGDRPLSGIRVLDLTRVIAGPVATRFLAAHGADVLRVDPPGFDEVALLLPETTLGKRCTALDLREPADRARFEELVSAAHVVVDGLRPDALAGLGWDPAALRAINPDITIVTHDAYGWSGPWAARRGFDSLVQMSTGIAAAGAAAAGTDRPVPLPVQALDHGTGFLLAAGACRALTERVRGEGVHEVRGSLVGAAHALQRLTPPDGGTHADPAWDDTDTRPATTEWGPILQVPIPGSVAGHPARFDSGRAAGALGRHPAEFTPI